MTEAAQAKHTPGSIGRRKLAEREASAARYRMHQAPSTVDVHAERIALEAVPITQRPAWRLQYRDLIIAERKATWQKPLDAQDMDHAVDSWSLGMKLSRE